MDDEDALDDSYETLDDDLDDDPAAFSEWDGYASGELLDEADVRETEPVELSVPRDLCDTLEEAAADVDMHLEEYMLYILARAHRS